MASCKEYLQVPDVGKMMRPTCDKMEQVESDGYKQLPTETHKPTEKVNDCRRDVQHLVELNEV